MSNGSADYKLGELQQFKKTALERLDRIEKKVDDLRVWKWKTMGAFGVICAAMSVGVSFAIKFINF